MLNFWDASWGLDERLCPCDVYFAEYLEEKGIKGASIFHFGTGSHHILGLRTAENGSNNAVLGITASPGEYDAYIHACEFRTEKNDTYGALTDLEMTLVLADALRPGGEMHFYTGSDGYKATLAVIDGLKAARGFADTGSFKTLRILTKPR
jgi:hypothetical protein